MARRTSVGIRVCDNNQPRNYGTIVDENLQRTSITVLWDNGARTSGPQRDLRLATKQNDFGVIITEGNK